MELRHLRYFTAVAGLLNFTKAAASLRVAQPALSRQIHDLEEELGVELFERTPRAVRLTAAGRAFVAEAQSVLDRVEEAMQVAKEFANSERGDLRLGYAPSPTVELLPQALNAMQGAAPSVRVLLHDLTSEEMMLWLREGRLDAALTPRASARSMRGLVFDPLREYATCVAMHRKHPLARRRNVTLAQLRNERIIALSHDEYPDYHEQLGIMFEPYGGPPPIAEEHDSGSSLIAAAEAGRGVLIVASSYACVAGPRLVLRGIVPSPAPLTVGIAYPRRPNALTRRFIQVVKGLSIEPTPSLGRWARGA